MAMVADFWLSANDEQMFVFWLLICNIFTLTKWSQEEIMFNRCPFRNIGDLSCALDCDICDPGRHLSSHRNPNSLSFLDRFDCAMPIEAAAAVTLPAAFPRTAVK